jgi:hypothetical protein
VTVLKSQAASHAHAPTRAACAPAKMPLFATMTFAFFALASNAVFSLAHEFEVSLEHTACMCRMMVWYCGW